MVGDESPWKFVGFVLSGKTFVFPAVTYAVFTYLGKNCCLCKVRMK